MVGFNLGSNACRVYNNGWLTLSRTRSDGFRAMGCSSSKSSFQTKNKTNGTQLTNTTLTALP